MKSRFANYCIRYLSYFLIKVGMHQYYVCYLPKYHYLKVVRFREDKSYARH